VIDTALFWQAIPVDVAVPVGREIPKKTLDWLMKNAEKNMRPLIYQQQDPASKDIQKNHSLLPMVRQLFKNGCCNNINLIIIYGSVAWFIFALRYAA